jgi:hypothetical protein
MVVLLLVMRCVAVRMLVVGEGRRIGEQARQDDDERNQPDTHYQPSPAQRHLGVQILGEI